MKKIGFVGGFDKTDLIMCIARILTELRQRVLVIDTTVLQKTRYIVPSIAPTRSYVTSYEETDVAIGFESFEDIIRYMGDIQDEYDYVLVDVDSNEVFNSFQIEDSYMIYFVTAFDNYSLKKGIEALGSLKQNIKMKKVLFEREITPENDEYLNLLTQKCPITWDEDIIHFPYDQGDLTVLMENQRVEKVKLRNLSEEYRTSLYILIQEIMPEAKTGDLRKIFKSI